MKEIETKNCYVKFGKLVKDARERHGLNQRELAEMLGITQPYLCKIEMGRRNISLELVMTLCRILKLDIQQFVEECIK